MRRVLIAIVVSFAAFSLSAQKSTMDCKPPFPADLELSTAANRLVLHLRRRGCWSDVGACAAERRKEQPLCQGQACAGDAQDLSEPRDRRLQNSRQRQNASGTTTAHGHHSTSGNHRKRT